MPSVLIDRYGWMAIQFTPSALSSAMVDTMSSLAHTELPRGVDTVMPRIALSWAGPLDRWAAPELGGTATALAATPASPTSATIVHVRRTAVIGSSIGVDCCAASYSGLRNFSSIRSDM